MLHIFLQTFFHLGGRAGGWILSTEKHGFGREGLSIDLPLCPPRIARKVGASSWGHLCFFRSLHRLCGDIPSGQSRRRGKPLYDFRIQSDFIRFLREMSLNDMIIWNMRETAVDVFSNDHSLNHRFNWEHFFLIRFSCAAQGRGFAIRRVRWKQCLRVSSYNGHYKFNVRLNTPVTPYTLITQGAISTSLANVAIWAKIATAFSTSKSLCGQGRLFVSIICFIPELCEFERQWPWAQER